MTGALQYVNLTTWDEIPHAYDDEYYIRTMNKSPAFVKNESSRKETTKKEKRTGKGAKKGEGTGT
jgi:hypothetical protein